MRRGFGLTETVLSFGLIGLLLIFVLNLFPSALAAQRSADERLQAATVARSALEQQLDQPFNQLPLGLRRELDPVTIGAIQYKVRLEVDQSPSADPKFLRVLRLVVGWKSKGIEREVKRELYKHRLPHQQNP